MHVFKKTFFLGIILGALCAPLAAQSSQPMYIYVPNGSGLTGNVGGIFSAFKVDPATGALSVVPGSPFQAGEGVGGIAVDPAGRYVYVSSIINGSTGALYVFSVDPTTGSLTPISGAPFPGAGGAIAIDPTGRFLYAGEYSYDLEVFSIDPVSGVPTSIAGSPFVFPGSEDYSDSIPIVIDPSGNFVYFQSSITSLINASINFETGAPTEVGVDPIPLPVGSDTAWVAMDPLDRFVALNGTEILAVSPTNNLLIPPPGATGTSGTSAFDPSGRFLYAEVDYCPDPVVLGCGPTAFSRLTRLPERSRLLQGQISEQGGFRCRSLI
jgi:6-phosphogluconolactonase